jgi:hypothetical protein
MFCTFVHQTGKASQVKKTDLPKRGLSNGEAILNYKLQLNMKKIITILAVSFLLAATASAQKQALGLRIGGGSFFGAEVSYQKDLSSAHRLEADLGVESNGMALTGVYQWVWDLADLSQGVKWYAGVGAGLRLDNNIGAGINGQIGIEYTLPDVPLQFSLDARPGWYAGNDYGFGAGAALGVRYKF